MMRSSFFKRCVCAGVMVMFCSASMTGCASLRKKFTRKSKTEKKGDDFIPVLQPVEYAKVVETPAQMYRDHYTMVKVYFKSLWDVLGTRDAGAKREKYIFVELLSRFDAMAALLSDDKKAEAQKLHARVEEVLKEYDKPQGLRRYDLMKSAMLRVERDIYKGFKPDVVKDSFAAAASGPVPAK